MRGTVIAFLIVTALGCGRKGGANPEVTEGGAPDLPSLSEVSVGTMAISADGKVIAVVGSVGPDRRLVCGVWDLATGRSVSQYGGPGAEATSFMLLRFSPDGTKVAGTSAGVTVWDAGTGKVLSTVPLERKETAFQIPTFLEFSTDGHVVFAEYDTRVFVVDIAKNNARRVWERQSFRIAYSPSRKLLVETERQNFETKTLFHQLTGSEQTLIHSWNGTQPYGAHAFSPDGRLLFTSTTPEIRWYEVPPSTKGLIGSWASPDAPVGRIHGPQYYTNIAVSRDVKYVAAAKTFDQPRKIYAVDVVNLAEASLVKRIERPPGRYGYGPKLGGFHAAEEFLFEYDGSLFVIDLKTGEERPWKPTP